VSPDCPEALADICGLKSASELPWQMQHWMKAEPYTGNSILDRLDPEEWMLTNPWRSLWLQVLLCSSRAALNERRKRLGLGKRDWDTEEAKWKSEDELRRPWRY
jgi:hypothetical protein